MSLSTPVRVYGERLAAREAAEAALERSHRRLGMARLVVFGAVAALAWLAWISRLLQGGWVALAVFVFIGLSAWHSRVLLRRERARRAVAFYRRGLDRLEDRWAGVGDDGRRYREPDHPYADDLDLFGPGSLFQLLCGARTRAGRDTLASWLKAPASPAEALSRQQAVADLTPRLDLREDLALLGDDVEVGGVHPAELARWAGSPPVLPGGAWRLLLALCSGLVLAAVIGWQAAAFGPGWLLLALALQGSMAFSLRARVRRVLEAVAEPGRELGLLAAVLARIEAESFSSPLLRRRRAELESGAVPPSAAVARLQGILDRLDWRRNQIFAPFGLLLNWSSQHALALEAWRRRFGRGVPRWLEAVAETEALCALAGQAWEHPEDVFPEFLDSGTPRLVAEGIGHPLLPAAACVRNDLSLEGERRLLLVSGSNMSGKSTLLRSVGVNAVLALAGAPVRARRMLLSPLAVGAAIRVVDSLQAGRSRFYAEITRLRALMSMAADGPPLLFLLDEILHGTNSHDRRIGAEAVVRGLLARGAFGLVTTHDLALARMAEDLAPAAANIHFQDHLEDGRMVFDYRIRHGVVERSNALALMRAVGLDV